MGLEAEVLNEANDELPLRPVLTLTEEELLVLTGGSLGVMPARLQEPEDPAAADLVRSVALRCLMARGLVLPTGAGQQSGGSWPTGASQQAGASQQTGASHQAGTSEQPWVSWAAVEPLGLTLQLRGLAPTVLGLRRTLAPLVEEVQSGGPESEGTSAVRYLHLHDEIAVIEDVTDDGMHGFLTVFPDRYQDAVADFIRPPDAIAGHGGVQSLDGTVEELLEALGGPTVLVETSLITGLGEGVPPREPGSQMLALGPGGSFRSHDSLSYHPVDPDGAIADLLREALGAAQLGETQAGNAEVGEGSGAGAGGPT